MLTIENEYTDNIDSVLQRILTDAQVQLQISRAAIVSSASEETRKRRSLQSRRVDGEETLLRLIVYAFDSNENPIETSDLIEYIIIRVYYNIFHIKFNVFFLLLQKT